MPGEDKVLVYEHRASDSGREGLKTMSRQELNDILEQNPQLQATAKKIYGQSSVDVYQKDLYTSAQKEAYATMPNYETNIATVHVGWWHALRHSELIILSKNKG